jgi:hypothetical protein
MVSIFILILTELDICRWRMQSDGTNQELTFLIIQIGLHPSPDNKWIVFISYLSEKQNHLFGKHVQLKLMNIATKQIQVITQFSMEVKALSMSHLGVQIVESSFCKLFYQII